MATSADSARDDDVSRRLLEALRRRKWQKVSELLRGGELSPDLHRRAVQQTCQYANEKLIIEQVLPYIEEAEMECALEQMMKRGMWNAVESALSRGISQTLRRWFVEEACEHASENMFVSYILPGCAEEQLDHVLKRAKERGLWQVVPIVVNRGAYSEAERDITIELAAQNATEPHFRRYIWRQWSYGKYDWLFKQLMKRGFTNAVHEVYRDFVVGVLCKWAGRDTPGLCSDEELWKVVNSCSNDEFFESLCGATRTFKGMSYTVRALESRLKWDKELCTLFSNSLAPVLGRKGRTELFNLNHGQETDTRHLEEHTEAVCDDIISFLQNHCDDDDRKDESFEDTFQDKLKTWSVQLMQCFEIHEMDQRSVLISLETFIRKYANIKPGYSNDKRLFVILCSMPLFVDVQCESLRMLIKEMLDAERCYSDENYMKVKTPLTNPQEWGIISKACLSRVGEQVRRELYQTAVHRKKWSVVKQWADHSLYDDQRGWTLQEAFKDKQWDVLLQLADHGLTDSEARRVHYRVAKYADWSLVRHMFERGADVTEMKELLEGTFHDKLISDFDKKKKQKGEHDNQAENQEVADLRNRCSQLAKLERKLHRRASRSFRTALKLGKWRIVLCRVIQTKSTEDLDLALEAAKEKEAWPVVMRLVKLGMDAAQRDALFPEMLRQQHWGVCRELLDKGLSVELCLDALPELMKLNQWTLVARVMEYDVGDEVRRQVLQIALDRREGSVVWQALTFMSEHASESERRAIFQHARRHRIWQAMKPLVEEKDSTGIAHRDTAMLDALEHCQWDVVDHCERFYADINMKDSDGRTALHRAVNKVDFEGVENIVARGGDQFLLDVDGYSPLHHASRGKHWKCVRTLIQFHGDINQPDPKGRTPIQHLIEHHQGELIDCSLFWGRDVSKGVSRGGETVLHASCRDSYPGSLYYLVCRGVDPLAVSKYGQTALALAVQRWHFATVKECIKLGFSTHQPAITEAWIGRQDTARMRSCEIVSPMEFAIIWNIPAIPMMLYESGACSYKELFRLYTALQEPPLTGKRGVASAKGSLPFLSLGKRRHVNLTLPYLKKMATTARTLKSTCRLVISHSLNVRGKRHKDVRCLPLPQPMRRYVMFSDLTHRGFGIDARKQRKEQYSRLGFPRL